MKIKYPIQLKDFQREGVRIIEQHDGNVLLADDMRLGKTVQTLSYIRRHRTETPIVVVCPAIAKWVWQEQAHDNFGIPTVVLEGAKVDKQLLRDNHFFIINYEILHHWVFWLKRIRPKTVILDECHYAKNAGAKRTKNARRLAKGWIHIDDGDDYRKYMKTIPDRKHAVVKQSLTQRAKHIIAISGTPLTNRPIELFPVLNMLWPRVFNDYNSYGMEYCDAGVVKGSISFKGARNLDKLHGKLKKLGMIRRLKRDVIKNYKEPAMNVVPIDMKSPAAYNRKHKVYLRALRKSQEAKLKRLSNFIELKRLAAEEKLPAVLEWVDHFLSSTDDKIVLFAHHQNVIRTLKKHYGDQAVVVDGSVSHKKRIDAQKAFRADKKVRIFIGNIQACGMAVSLKVADTVAFVELPFTPGDLRQCEDRVFDITKNNQLFVYYLVARGTIEEIVCRLLQNKAQVLSQILDGKGKGVQISIYSQLEQMIKGNHHG